MGNEDKAKWLILLYRSVKEIYDIGIRKILFEVCSYAEIKDSLENSRQILEVIESVNIPESKILAGLRKLPLQIRNPEERVKLAKRKTE